ncbi:gamma-glutamyl phosphate reductase [Candidatus Symbiothrix dinenymphae]|nr:gamma-glutamyl phosphate reductase [Candidatus Symbiothrix dinenymphae]
MNLTEQIQKTKEAALALAQLSSEDKNKILHNIAVMLAKNSASIIAENQKDLAAAQLTDISEVMLKRLTLTEKDLQEICLDIEDIILLPDPVGEILETVLRPNGLKIEKVCVPLGTVLVIYESRPNVTVDVATLSLKCGNACVLKGGSEAINTNRILAKLLREAIQDTLDPNVVTFIDTTDRKATDELLTMHDLIDVVIPRGSHRLIKYVVNNAKIPVIETGAGNCHLYVEQSADLKMALEIALNAKVSKPAVCNAIETLLVDEAVAEPFLRELVLAFEQHQVEIRGCEQTRKIIPAAKPATEEDYATEYNDLIIAVAIVKDYKAAIRHINRYSTKHSETIVSGNQAIIDAFLNAVNSACCYVNASTRFTDGGCFGFGAEFGISTGMLHARGPMGLKELTSYKYKIYGKGQIRV